MMSRSFRAVLTKAMWPMTLIASSAGLPAAEATAWGKRSADTETFETCTLFRTCNIIEPAVLARLDAIELGLWPQANDVSTIFKAPTAVKGADYFVSIEDYVSTVVRRMLRSFRRLIALRDSKPASFLNWARRCIEPSRAAFGSRKKPLPSPEAVSGDGLRFKHWPAHTGATLSPEDAIAAGMTSRRLAQFQLPPATAGKEVSAVPMPSRLTYQYSLATESVVDYRRDRDLNKRVRDNSLIVTPELNGIVVYRPTDWLETTLEGVIGKEFPLQEEARVVLPSGAVQVAQTRSLSAVVDQAYVRIHNIIAPFEVAVGRRNYEDERHWLWDTSMDVASIAYRSGRFRIEAFGGRETWVDLDAAPNSRQVKDKIDTYVVYADYRFEGLRVAAYTVSRDDRTHNEGRPQLIGVRALGRPSDDFNYWLELAHLMGKDAASNNYMGNGFDVGFTHQWTRVSHLPSITLGYAFGSGDGNPNDKKNHDFRQTGLQANETRFAGISQFKIYGEALDPELTNLKIFTLGVGFRPAPNISLDVVYHKYRLHSVSEHFHSGFITAEINQLDNRHSKDFGSALDVIVGVRRLFGIRRLGLDFRAGWFSPGNAFLRNDGTNQSPSITRGNKSIGVVAKIWF